METITIKQTINIPKEIEKTVALPYYTKGEWHFYKVIDKDYAIQVFNGFNENSASVEFVSVSLAFGMAEKDSTEIEFQEAFTKAITRLNK
jgi:hypothetical protein